LEERCRKPTIQVVHGEVLSGLQLRPEVHSPVPVMDFPSEAFRYELGLGVELPLPSLHCKVAVLAIIKERRHSGGRNDQGDQQTSQPAHQSLGPETRGIVSSVPCHGLFLGLVEGWRKEPTL
jgi:hypothetical protein